MNDTNIEDKIKQAAGLIKNSKHTTAFTGSGISVESGIPPFRGKGGLWTIYDPTLFEIGYFRAHPKESWEVTRDIFFGSANKTKPAPNDAHKGIVALEKMGLVKAVITQNVDNLHYEAGSRNVFEFHGTGRTLSCLSCKSVYETGTVSLETVPPLCPSCMGILKPDFVYFGEPIPKEAMLPSFYEAQTADVFLVVGTTGEVMPACQVPIQAKENGAKIIEINIDPSSFTPGVTDIFLRGKATEMMNRLVEEIHSLAAKNAKER